MKTILIIKLSALGDIVVASPHINTVVDYYSKDRIVLVTGQLGAPFFEAHPRIESIILDRKKWFGKTNLRNVIRKIKRFDPSIVFDLQGNRISRKLVKKSGAAVKIGTQPLDTYTHHPKTEYTRDVEVSVFDRLNETLVSAGLPEAEAKGHFYASDKSQSAVASFKKRNGLHNNSYFLMHAGSASDWPSKRWPGDNYENIAEKLEKLGVRVVWIGGKEDKHVNRQLSEKTGIDATGQFSPLEVYVLAKEAVGALANDSGPMHICGAANIPVFGFFGPTSHYRSHALGQKERVLFNNSHCSPCYLGKCKNKEGHICLADISVDLIWEKISSEIRFERSSG